MSINIRKLNNDDVPEVERFLAQHIETSMFMISNIRQAGLKYSGQDYSGEHWGAYDSSGTLTGVLAQFWNGNIMVQAPDKDALSQLCSVFTAERTRKIKGIVGHAGQSGVVIDALGLSADDFAMNELEGLFALDLDDLSYTPRDGCTLISPADMDQKILFDWMKAYDIEALGSDDSPALDKRISDGIKGKWQVQNRRVLVHDGVPVSLAGCNAKVDDMNQIGPVWTPPEHRNNGYARIVTAMLLEQEKAAGMKRSILFTKEGSTAERAYLSIGYKCIGDFRLALLK